MKKQTIKVIAIVLIVVIVLFSVPMGTLLQLKTSFFNCSNTISEAVNTKFQDIELLDFSENTHIEKVYDSIQEKIVYPNGGYDTYYALRKGNIKVQLNNRKQKLQGKLCYTFTATRNGLTTVVWVPISAFQSTNVGTNFDNVSASLSNAAQAGVNESEIKCLYKRGKVSTYGNLSVYSFFCTWLDFSYQYESAQECFSCKRNGYVKLEYYTKYLKPVNPKSNFKDKFLLHTQWLLHNWY